MPVSKCDLKIDWATHNAARYACEHWHYSRVMVMPQCVKIGVWENGKFVGVVLFNRGACNDLGKKYALKNTETCELVRIALTTHKTQVSRILKIAIKFLKKKCSGIKLIVSFADPNEGHYGGIYQATNWIYTGTTAPSVLYFDKSGRRQHPRNLSEKGWVSQFGKKKLCLKPSDCVSQKVLGKHRYLLPLDSKTRKTILPLARPYPKRAGSDTKDTPANLAGEGGSTPTPALQ
jgi:hypothetical protein